MYSPSVKAMSWRDFFQTHFDKFMLGVMWAVTVAVALTMTLVVKSEKAFDWAAGIESMIIGALLRDIIGTAIRGPAPSPGTTDTTSTTTTRSSHTEESQAAPPKPIE